MLMMRKHMYTLSSGFKEWFPSCLMAFQQLNMINFVKEQIP